MKLNSKLTLTTLCTALLPLVFVMVVSLWHSTDYLRVLTIDSAHGHLQAGAEKLSGYFAQRIEEMATYANMSMLRTMDWKEIEPYLGKELKRHKGIYEKLALGTTSANYYVTSGGNPAYGGLVSFDNSNPTAKLKSMHKRKYWQYLVGNNAQAEDRTYVSDPMISYTTGVRQVLVGSSILSEDGLMVLGMIGGTIQWETIESLIDEVQNKILEDFGRSAKFCLVTHNGIYAYHWNPAKSIHLELDEQGKPLLNDIGEKVSVRVKITDEPSVKLAQAGQDMINGRDGFVFFTDPELEKEMVVIYAPVRSANYAIAMFMPKDQIMAPVKSLRWFFACITLTSLAFVMAVYLFVAKKVTSPIDALSHAVKDLADGDWQTKVFPKGNDEVSKLAVAFNEMTDSLKKREQALRESEERFRAIFESTSDCIFVWDRNNNYLFANQAAITHIGTTRENMRGKKMGRIVAHMPDLLKSWNQHIGEVLEKGEELRAEDTVMIGEEFVYNESVFSPIRNAKGGVIAVSVVYRDITKRKKYEEQVMEHMNELSEANQRMEVLIANTTGREKRMIQLKQEVNDMLVKSGKEIKYHAPKNVEEMLSIGD